MNPRRLYRSRDRQLAGVAGGMAEYLDIDPTVVRILWIIVGIASGGLALIAYLILALVIPASPYAAAPGAGWTAPAAPAGWSASPQAGWTTAPAGTAGWTAPAPPDWNPQAAAAPAAPPVARPAQGRGLGVAAIVGVVLIVIGAIALADVVLPGWAVGVIMGPAIILALGAAILVASIRRPAPETPASAAPAASYAAPAYPAAPEAPAATVTDPGPAAQDVTAMQVEPAPWDQTDTESVTGLVAPSESDTRSA